MKPSDREWRELLALSGDLADAAIHDPAGGVDRLMDSLYRLTGADEGFIMFSRRAGKPRRGDPLRGWRPVHSIYNRRSEERARIAAEWYSEPARLLSDVNARRLMERTGATRALVRSDVAARLARDERMVDTPLLDALGVEDRVIAGTSLDAEVEVVVGLDRRRGANFSAEEAGVAGVSLAHLGWYFRRLARHLGVASEPGPRLTPREAQTLRALLTGGAEKALAREMGVAASTFHQHVKSVYRKFGVRSRPGLMARFVGVPVPRRPLPEPRYVVGRADAPDPRMEIVAL